MAQHWLDRLEGDALRAEIGKPTPVPMARITRVICARCDQWVDCNANEQIQAHPGSHCVGSHIQYGTCSGSGLVAERGRAVWPAPAPFPYPVSPPQPRPTAYLVGDKVAQRNYPVDVRAIEMVFDSAGSVQPSYTLEGSGTLFWHSDLVPR